MNLDDGFVLSDEFAKKLGLSDKVEIKWDDCGKKYKTQKDNQTISVTPIGDPAVLRTSWIDKIPNKPKLIGANLFTCNPPQAREVVQPDWVKTARYFCLGFGFYTGPTSLMPDARDVCYYDKAISFFTDL